MRFPSGDQLGWMTRCAVEVRTSIAPPAAGISAICVVPFLDIDESDGLSVR